MRKRSRDHQNSSICKEEQINSIDQNRRKVKKIERQEYRCGEKGCGKVYHSYTAFYNHCKKNHSGEFPQDSKLNNQPFLGPSKNRGRPRIKKNDAKDQIQIKSMRTENQLIQFLGTLKSPKNQQLVVYVQNPIQRLQQSIDLVLKWISEQVNNPQLSDYFEKLKKFNDFVAQKDLPEFYDPIDALSYQDNLDSYNFNSIYNYVTQKKNSNQRLKDLIDERYLYNILIIWLTRILSSKLLAEVVYSIVQFIFKTDKVKESEEIKFLKQKSSKFKEIIDKFFKCFDQTTQNQQEQESQR